MKVGDITFSERWLWTSSERTFWNIRCYWSYSPACANQRWSAPPKISPPVKQAREMWEKGQLFTYFTRIAESELVMTLAWQGDVLRINAIQASPWIPSGSVPVRGDGAAQPGVCHQYQEVYVLFLISAARFAARVIFTIARNFNWDIKVKYV